MTQISSLGDWRMEIEKLEGAGLGKEEDRCNFRQKELEFWVAFQLEMFSKQDWSFGEITRIGKICLELKLIKIITEPGEWMGNQGRRWAEDQKNKASCP